MPTWPTCTSSCPPWMSHVLLLATRPSFLSTRYGKHQSAPIHSRSPLASPTERVRHGRRSRALAARASRLQSSLHSIAASCSTSLALHFALARPPCRCRAHRACTAMAAGAPPPWPHRPALPCPNGVRCRVALVMMWHSLTARGRACSRRDRRPSVFACRGHCSARCRHSRGR
jgi:hypothetical protein